MFVYTSNKENKENKYNARKLNDRFSNYAKNVYILGYINIAESVLLYTTTTRNTMEHYYIQPYLQLRRVLNKCI